MKIKTAKFGVAVKIGKHGNEINFAQDHEYEMSMEGMFLKMKQKFGEGKICLVCVTNIAYMEVVNEQVSGGSVSQGDQKKRATKAKTGNAEG
jgi:hypothetical protein